MEPSSVEDGNFIARAGQARKSECFNGAVLS
jgi:hypothetical protein